MKRPPETAAKTLQSYVSRLRKALGDGVLETTSAGYRVVSGAYDLDRVRAFARRSPEVRRSDGRRTSSRGRRLTNASGPQRRAVLLIPANPLAFSEPQDFVAVLRRDLARLGIQLAVRRSDDLGRIASSPNPDFDMTLLEFEPDFPDPGSVLNHLFETGFSASDGLTAATTSRYSSLELDRRLRRAAKLRGEARLRAYAQLDADIARNIAPLIPVGTVAQLDTFSERTGCQRYNTRAGIVLGALCLDRRAG